MKNLHTFSIDVLYKGQSRYESNDAHGTASRAVDAVITAIDETGNLAPIYIHPQVNLEEVQHLLRQQYGTEDIEFRDGVSEGCYGARTGNILKGFTMHIDASLLPTRGIDDEGDEWVNPIALLEEVDVKHIPMSEETLEDFLEASDFPSNQDNSYNWGHSDDQPYFKCDFDFETFKVSDNNSEALYLVVKFHFGGDPRGNYGRRHMFKFESEEEVYSFLYPNFHITNPDEEN